MDNAIIDESSSVVSGDETVAFSTFAASGSVGLIAQPVSGEPDLAAWIKANAQVPFTLLNQHGFILFRGFHVPTMNDFQELVASTGRPQLDYRYGSSPRTRVDGDVYTSTEVPKEQHIPLHNEMAYTTRWPSFIWFWCDQPPSTGGETPLADSRGVYNRISESTRELFARRRLAYKRIFYPDSEIPWQKAFDTDDPREVEAFCTERDISCLWYNPEILVTRQVCQAVTVHEATGASVWFNQAHIYHPSVFGPYREDAERAVGGAGFLSRQVFFGDDEPIPEEMLDEVRDAYAAEEIAFEWQKGDVLAIDNLLVAHARRSYTGERRVFVAMTD